MISGYLTKEGFDNVLLDANSSRKTIGDVRKVIKDKSPDIILFSTSTCTIYQDLQIPKVAKEINTSIVTVAIGTHVMALPEDTFRESMHLDVIVYSNEWEQTSLNIVKNILDLESAKGIFFRKSCGEIVKTADPPPTNNLDDLGFPAHDKLEKKLYRDPTTRRAPKTMVMGQRACINDCSFCCQPAFFGAPVIRRRSVQHFVEELKWVQQLGFKEVMFNDATLTADIEWSSTLFEHMLSNSVDLVWNCSTRADCVDKETLKLMKKAGCHTIAIGMESANITVLKNIRKNIVPEQIREAVRLIREGGMDSLVYCVIGFSGETKESILETIAFLNTLDATFITLGIAVPAPGTDFFNYVEENNFLLTKDWSMYDPMKRPVFNYPWLSADEMAYYSSYGLRKFYLRPKYILKRLCSIKNFSDVNNYAVNFIGFVRRYVISKRN